MFSKTYNLKTYEFLESLREILNLSALSKQLKNGRGKALTSSFIAKCEVRAERPTGQPFIYPKHVLEQMASLMLGISTKCLAAFELFTACASHYEIYVKEGAEKALQKYKENSKKVV